MDNLRSPAYPSILSDFDGQDNALGSSYTDPKRSGFTKLEKAAIMIAAGIMSGAWSDGITHQQVAYIKEASVLVAKGVLEEANK